MWKGGCKAYAFGLAGRGARSTLLASILIFGGLSQLEDQTQQAHNHTQRKHHHQGVRPQRDCPHPPFDWG
jgi:hypothetical protein